jgi:hypothetical protein
VFSGAAATWPNAPNAVADIVPVVANRRIYVASCEQLTIWGLTQRASAKNSSSRPLPLQSDVVYRLKLLQTHEDPYGTRAGGHLDQPDHAIGDVLRIGRDTRKRVSKFAWDLGKSTIIGSPGLIGRVGSIFGEDRGMRPGSLVTESIPNWVSS